jgi:hypothetical protein
MSTPIREGLELAAILLTSCRGSLRGKVYTETCSPLLDLLLEHAGELRVEPLENGDLPSSGRAITPREVRSGQSEVGDGVR